MFKRIDHVELVPINYERTVGFYIDILGFKIKERKTMTNPPLREIVFLTLGDTMIEILNVENPGSAPDTPLRAGFSGIALEVDDMDKTVAYLNNNGVGIAWGPMNIGGSIRAEIRDPDGFTIELRQW